VLLGIGPLALNGLLCKIVAHFTPTTRVASTDV
jgi:hypothetical protein